MSTLTIGVLLFIFMLVLMAIRVPIAVAMFVPGVVGYVALSGWDPLLAHLLRAAGADVGYVIPHEGALAWLDCWVITRGARNRTLAHAWIDYMLEPGPAEVLSQRHGLNNTRSQPTHQADADRLVWLEPVEDVERRNLLWERILSGDRAARVLAP